MTFRDRQDAAEQLIPLLEKFRGEKGIVLAIPRGGIPLGYIIAKHLHFPLEPLLTKKIGYPGNEELAIGAVSMHGRVLDPRFRVSSEYVEAETIRIQALLQVRYKQLMGNRKPAELKGKTLIVVDDGIATGNTILAAVRMLKAMQPGRIVIAVPVAPSDTIRRLEKEASEVICVLVPQTFYGVGQFYDDFSQVSDEEVIRLMTECPG